MDLEQVRELLTRGRCVTALRVATEAAEQSTGAQRAQYLLLAAGATTQLGMHRETARLAGDALAAATDTILQAKARIALAAAALYQGDPHQAEDYLVHVNLAALPDDLAGPAQYNLGMAYEAKRRHDAASGAYAAAAEKFRRCGQTHHECLARLNLAWLRLDRADLGWARRELARVAEIAAPSSTAQAQLLAMEAMAARIAGQSAEAVRICEDLLVPGQGHVTGWCRCFAAWLTATMALDEGRPDLARQFLDRARREAEAARDPCLWNRLTELQNRLDQS